MPMIGGGCGASKVGCRPININRYYKDPVSTRIHNLNGLIPDMLRAYKVANIAELKDVLRHESAGPGRHFLPKSNSAISKSLVYLPSAVSDYKYKVRLHNVSGEQHLFLEETPFLTSYILLKFLIDINCPVEYIPTEIIINSGNRYNSIFISVLPPSIRERFYEEEQRYSKRWTDLDIILKDISKLTRLGHVRLSDEDSENEDPATHRLNDVISENMVSNAENTDTLLRKLHPSLDGVLIAPPLDISADELRTQAKRTFEKFNREADKEGSRMSRRKIRKARKNTRRRK